MKDDEYFKGILKGNVKAEDKFYRKNWPLIKDLVVKLKDQHQLDAQDIYQQAVAIVFNKIKNGRLSPQSSTTYLSDLLYRIASGICLSCLKEQSPGYVNEALPERDEEQEGYREGQVLEVVKKIESPYNRMLIDRYINRFSYQEIAVKYNYSNYKSAEKKTGQYLKKTRQIICTKILHTKPPSHA